MGRFGSDEQECRHGLCGGWRGHDMVSRFRQAFMAGEAKGFEPRPQTNGLAGSRVNCMTTDPQGRLWVGTDDGIAMWDGARFQSVPPTNVELPENVEFHFRCRRRPLVGGRGRPCARGDERRWVLDAESLKNVFTGNLSRMGTREDHHGGLWLYDYGRGLCMPPPKARRGSLVRRKVFPGIASIASSKITRATGGPVWTPGDWCGFASGGSRPLTRADRFHQQPARSVCEESNGTVWIGTLGDGLARWQAGVLTNLTMPGGTDKGFVFCVCPDAAGRLWVSAGDEDLFVGENGRFKRVVPVVHGVKSDSGGQIRPHLGRNQERALLGRQWNIQQLQAIRGNWPA